MLTLLLVALDQTVVGTAMPRIIAELNGLSVYAWVTTAYLVASTVVVPVAGKLGDMFGRKPFILVGMVGFMAGSWLCGFSQNMTELILFRSLQGAFGGMLFANTFTVLADIFDAQQRVRMQGIFGAVFGLASVIGPTFGGYITDNWGWRWSSTSTSRSASSQWPSRWRRFLTSGRRSPGGRSTSPARRCWR